ncbi:MAG: hypothetical protein JSS53_09280 [Proteobacteria bacterium]|nr:hypothetical protein [Pseudomonadota bacterium]
MFRIAMVIVCFFAVTACGPMYRTNYNYIPPVDMQGKMCAMQCEQVKLQCFHLAEAEYQNCRLREEINMREERHHRHHDKKGHWNDFYGSFCSADTTKQQCESSYRSCYEICGGRVVTNTQCVAFCDKR